MYSTIFISSYFFSFLPSAHLTKNGGGTIGSRCLFTHSENQHSKSIYHGENMKKFLTSLFAFMALALAFTSCKNDSNETEEKFTQRTKEDIANSEDWLKGEWNGEIQILDVQASKTYLEKNDTTEEEIKTEFRNGQETANPKMTGTISLSNEDSLKSFKDFLYRCLNSNENPTYYISTNENKTKMILEIKSFYKESEDSWLKSYVKILYTKK